MKNLKRFLVSIFLGANLFSILLLWGCCACTFFSPTYNPTYTVIVLGFPFLVAINVAFVFFWLIFKVKLIWVPLIGLLCVSSYLLDYCPIHISRPEAPDSSLVIMTYNGGGAHEDSTQAEIVQLWKEMKPDILCMQESSWIGYAKYRQVLDSMDYNIMCNAGLYIITRLPIVSDSIPIHYPTEGNNSLACKLAYQGDTILLINNHLESNKLTPDDKAEYKDMIKDPHREKVEAGSRLISGKLETAAKYRGSQTDTICALLDRHKGENIILLGDFNDTPISYTYQQIGKRMHSAMRESGQGIGITYNQKGFFVRIDHIFYTDDWKSYRTQVVDKIQASDHYPVITYLQKITK